MGLGYVPIRLVPTPSGDPIKDQTGNVPILIGLCKPTRLYHSYHIYGTGRNKEVEGSHHFVWWASHKSGPVFIGRVDLSSPIPGGIGKITYT